MSPLQRLSPLWPLVLGAFSIRLIALNQSLWLDEAITANVVQTHSYVDIVRQFSLGDFHPPLHYWVVKAWGSLFGFTEVSLRFPSVIASLIAGYAVYRIGRLFKSESVGLWSAAFFLFNPLIIYYSQEARMYALVTMWIALNFWCWLELRKQFSTKWAVWFALTLIVSFATFYGSVFYIGAFGVYALLKRQWKLAGLTALSFGMIALLLLPLLLKQLAHSREMLAVVTNWHSVLGSASLKNLLLIPVKLTSGRISFEPKLVYYSLAGVWLGIVGIFSALGHKHRLLLWMAAVPLALGLVFSIFSPLLQYFRFMYLLVPVSVLLALGTERFKAARLFLLLGFIAWSLLYLLFPRFHREDWRSLSQLVGQNDAPVYMILSSGDPLRYYLPDQELLSLQSFSVDEQTAEIQVIPYTAEIHGLSYSEVLSGAGYVLDKTTSLRGLSIEQWQRH